METGTKTLVAEWDALDKTWLDTSDAAHVKQIELDIKLRKHLENNGPAPTQNDQELVRESWQPAIDARAAMDEFISRYFV